MHIRLIKKLAGALNGFDLRRLQVGEVIDLDDRLARMLIAERWAEEIIPVDSPSTSNERSPRMKRKRAKRRDSS